MIASCWVGFCACVCIFSPGLGRPHRYDHVSKLPADECRKLRIFIDKKHEAVVLPIFSMMTPFHISLIKTVSQTDETDRTSYLRINFVTPGITVLRSQPYPEVRYCCCCCCCCYFVCCYCCP